VGGFQHVFGVACPLPPGLVLAAGQVVAVAVAWVDGSFDRVGDPQPGGGVVVEEGAGDGGFSELEMIIYLGGRWSRLPAAWRMAVTTRLVV
jgi:hypothetical protein